MTLYQDLLSPAVTMNRDTTLHFAIFCPSTGAIHNFCSAAFHKYRIYQYSDSKMARSRGWCTEYSACSGNVTNLMT
jgi:hypothetical protein